MTSVEYAPTYHHAKKQAAWELGQALVGHTLKGAPTGSGRHFLRH